MDTASTTGEVSLRVSEIIQMILDRGHLTKDEIKAVWGISEAQYVALKERLDTEKLIEPGPRGAGGFVAHFARRPKQASAASEAPLNQTTYESDATNRLAELLTHEDLEALLGDLLYTIRRARIRQTGEDRRGTKLELAAALVAQHGIDLFADPEIRKLVGKRAKAKPPGRWHPGKGQALRFVAEVAFPDEFAGIPAEETPPDFEYLEGRTDLRPLQDFQREVQGKLFQTLQRPTGRAIVTLPTGAGKTRVAVDTIRDWLTARYAENQTGPGRVVIWLAHTEELCEQAYACFKEVWQASNGVCPALLFRFWGGFTQDMVDHRETLLTIEHRPTVLVSTPQRLVNLIEGKVRGGEDVLAELVRLAGLLVVDEAHRAAAPSYRAIIGAFCKAKTPPRVIGLTATPFRQEYAPVDPLAGTRELREIFEAIIDPEETLGADPRLTLQERGYLARPVFESIKTRTILRAPTDIDADHLTEVDIERVDYALKLRADNPDRRMLVFERLREIGRESQNLIIYFGPTVQDAECMTLLLRQEGIAAAFVSGGTRSVTRRKIISDFKAGRTRVLCNCEVLTTGFDAPKVTHIVMARPTVSQVLYEQMVGRGLRGERFGGTATCVVIDLEDNYRTERPRLGYQHFRELWQGGRAGRG